MAKVTLRERAERWAAPLGMDFNPNAIGQRCMRQGFTAGWHARGRADRVPKAERAVVEAAVKWSRHCSLDNSATLHHAAKLLEVERAKGRK